MTNEKELISEPIEIHLTSNEVVSLSEFMKEHLHEDCNYHNFRLISVIGPVGSCLTVSCDHCNESKNITDYDAW
jgi:hypothetical protein